MGWLGVLGDLVEDIVVWQEEPLRHATDTKVVLRRTRGGSAANVAAFAAALRPTRFLGCVGQDSVGDKIIAELGAEGVEVRAQRTGVTGTVIVLVDPQGERSMLPDRGAATQLTDVPSEWLDGLDHLHVPAYSFTAEPTASTAIACMRSTRARGATNSVDASSTGTLQRHGLSAIRDTFALLAPDLLFANRSEADVLDLWDGRAPGPFRQRLENSTIVVKDGANPTTIMPAQGGVLTVPVAKVRTVRDLTGAGDAFAAAFLAARLGGADLRRAAIEGHSTAAAILETPGAKAPGT